jgi:Bacterial SH3 domain
MRTPTKAIFLWSFLFSIALHAQTKPDQYVFAAGGLTLRQKPDLKSKKVKHLPFGTGVVLKANKHPDEHQTEIFTGYKVKGRWLKVKVDSLEGYVLSAFLSDLKPPKVEEEEGMKADRDMFDHYYRQNSQPKGDRVYGKIENGEVYTQKYRDGASLEVRRFEGGSMRTLTFNDNTSLTEAYLISRHLWFGEKQVKGLTYDAVKKRIACESMDGLTTLSLEIKNGRTVAVFALAD